MLGHQTFNYPCCSEFHLRFLHCGLIDDADDRLGGLGEPQQDKQGYHVHVIGYSL